MERTCRYCDALRQCPYLSDSAGGFVPERLITEDNPRECDRWSPITPRQNSFRQRLCDSSAFIGAVKFIHSDLPEMMMKDLAIKEMEEARMEGATPDFAGMLRQGMSVSEREEQLRYETDETGNLALDDEGNPTYRPCYQLKQFVTTEGSHVQLGLPVVWAWTTNRLVDHILKSEVEQGLIVKPKKTRAAAKTAETQESEMAGEGRRVMVHQGGKAAPAPGPQAAPPPGPPSAPVNVQVGGPGRVATPPMRTGVPGPVAGPPVGAPRAVNPRTVAAPPPAAPAAAVVNEDPGPDPTVAGSELASLVQQVVEAALDNLGNELRLAIGTEVKKQLEGLRNEVVQHITAGNLQMLQAVTLAHDVAVRTSGSYWYPLLDSNGQQVVTDGQPQYEGQAQEMWDHPDLILGIVGK